MASKADICSDIEAKFSRSAGKTNPMTSLRISFGRDDRETIVIELEFCGKTLQMTVATDGKVGWLGEKGVVPTRKYEIT